MKVPLFLVTFLEIFIIRRLRSLGGEFLLFPLLDEVFTFLLQGFVVFAFERMLFDKERCGKTVQYKKLSELSEVRVAREKTRKLNPMRAVKTWNIVLNPCT